MRKLTTLTAVAASVAAAALASPAWGITLESCLTGAVFNVAAAPGTAGTQGTDYVLGTFFAGGGGFKGHGFKDKLDFDLGHFCGAGEADCFVSGPPAFTETGALVDTDHNWLQGTAKPIVVDVGAANADDRAIVFNSTDHLGVQSPSGTCVTDADQALWNKVVEGIEFTVYGTNNLADALAAAGTTSVFRASAADEAGTVPGAGAGSTFEQADLEFVFEDGWEDSGNAVEGDDYASVWKFPSGTAYQYIAVFSDFTDPFVGDGFRSFDNELDAIGVFIGTPGERFTKDLTSGPDVDGDGEIDIAIEVGQFFTTEYDFTMTYSNPGGPPVLIVDTAPAEWIVTAVEGDDTGDGPDPLPVGPGDLATFSNDFGTVEVFKTGKGAKSKSSTKILWRPDPDGGSINVVMETRQSPGKKNVKFAPTSCGPLFLNSGLAKVFEVDPATGEPLRDPVTGELLPPLFTAEPLLLAAVEDLDGGGIDPSGGGNEDGDALTDLEDVQLGFDPCSVGTGTLFAGTDQEEFAGLLVDRLAATPVDGGVLLGPTVIHTTEDFMNGLAPTGTGTLFSGFPGSSDHREITVTGTTISTVTGPLPTHRFNEDLAFDGTHVWRAHFGEGPLFKYLPDGTFVDSFAQTDVVGATFVRPADVLWITKWSGRQVGTFDPGTNTFTPVIDPTPTNAGGLAYDVEQGILWLGLQGGLVQAYDLTAGAALIAGSQHTPFGAIGDTVDGLAFIAD